MKQKKLETTQFHLFETSNSTLNHTELTTLPSLDSQIYSQLRRTIASLHTQTHFTQKSVSYVSTRCADGRESSVSFDTINPAKFEHPAVELPPPVLSG